jgi:hypothetical protein
MNKQEDIQEQINAAAKRALLEAEERRKNASSKIMPKEINGFKRAEPTRFDDWEKNGIICDF